MRPERRPGVGVTIPGMASSAKRWASAEGKPVPEVLMAECQRRGREAEYARLMGQGAEAKDGFDRLSRVLAQIEARYGAPGRLNGDYRASVGKRQAKAEFDKDQEWLKSSPKFVLKT